MGYDIHQFVETIDVNLVCSICGSVFENPVLTPCGHSFCLMCLETWLQTSLTHEPEPPPPSPPQLYQLRYRRPRSFPSAFLSPITASCPECRKPVHPNEAKPEIALRNLINGYYMFCPFRKNGCYIMTKLEQLKKHESKCPHSPVKCASCGTTVRMINLAEHQIKCQSLAALIEDSDDSYDRQDYTPSKVSLTDENTSVEFAQLLKMMQEQMNIFKTDLPDANDRVQGSKHYSKVKKVNMKRPKSLINNTLTSRQESSRNTVTSQNDSKSNCLGLHWFENSINKDGNRTYSYSTPQSIPATKMAAYIFRYLLNKPTYIDSRRVFRAIQKFYDDFTISSHLYDNTVHVLVATALASNWFTEIQQNCLNQWQQSLVKCHELLESRVQINLEN